MLSALLSPLLGWTLAVTNPAPPPPGRDSAATHATAAEPRLHFRVEPFADARDLPNAVAFTVDEHGTVFTANSLRYGGHGIFDVRRFPALRAQDVTSRSVEDRRRLMRTWIAEHRFDTPGQTVTESWLAGFSEQVRRLEDRDGDGRADHVQVIADGMNDLVSGAAAGVLAWDGRVYATIIPDLMVMPDTAHANTDRRVLQSGFGVHLGQAGHDMHGLTIGLDGRLYWSIADRGYRFTTREGRTFEGHAGGVFRCWPDGSELERFATGLRNPQELAFTDAGDLFTGDNNADLGDRSRLLYLPAGSDAGWRFFLQSVRDCGPWTEDHLWEMRGATRDADPPAWVNTPVAYAGSCPAGFAAYPGTGLPSREDGTLWLADFVGGVDAFKLEPRGAGFARTDIHEGFREGWGICDFDFDVAGDAWVLYWGEDWDRNTHGRLSRLVPTIAGVDTAAVREVRTLFANGFGTLADARLVTLLGHADRRVRQRASFELARRGRVAPLADAAVRGPSPRARMHARAW